MGGYGLYYATVMQAVGLVALADRRLGLTVDAVTPAGQRVAEAFRSVVADTEYYRHCIDRHDEPVPYAAAAEYGRRACFCRLREPGASDRPILVDAFLHLGNPGESPARRETLRFMCELSAQSAAAPVDESSFRLLIYFGADRGDEHSEGTAFVPSEPILRTARRWRLYQAREYFNASINEMWRRLTCWGLQREGDRAPLPMTEQEAALDILDRHHSEAVLLCSLFQAHAHTRHEPDDRALVETRDAWRTVLPHPLWQPTKPALDDSTTLLRHWCKTTHDLIEKLDTLASYVSDGEPPAIVGQALGCRSEQVTITSGRVNRGSLGSQHVPIYTIEDPDASLTPGSASRSFSSLAALHPEIEYIRLEDRSHDVIAFADFQNDDFLHISQLKSTFATCRSLPSLPASVETMTSNRPSMNRAWIAARSV